MTWSDLEAGDADEAIAAQIRRFGELPGPWEWKHYSHDRPGAPGRERGFSHLFVDASPQSRPILERLGFVALAETTPFTHPASAEQGSERRDDP